MIQVNNLSKQYLNGRFGVQNVSLNIPGSQLVFLAGPTGSGKTTLAKLLALRIRPTHGNIVVGDHDLTQLHGKQVARYRRSVGMIFRDLPLLENQSVGSNVAIPLHFQNMPTSKVTARVANALDNVGLRNKMEFYPDDLSSSEQQRIRIARAFVTRPVLIIADEPTADMDSQMSEKVMQVFKRYVTNQKSTVVVTTHDRAHLTDYKNLVFELRKGRLETGMQ